MDAKKVITSNLFKEDYVYNNGAIFNKEYFLKANPRLKNKINKLFADTKLKPTQTFVHKFSTKPKSTEIVNELEKLRKRIYGKTKIHSIKGQDKQAIQAGVLFNYLTKHIMYDMTVTENREADYTESKKITKKLYALLKEFSKAGTKLDNSKTKEEYKKNLKEFEDLKEELEKFKTKAQKARDKEEEVVIAEMVYNVLNNKQGVCADFSNTYLYLLKGLSIKCFNVAVAKDDNDAGHAFNIIGIRHKGKMKYLICDVTFNNDYYRDYNQEYELAGFGWGQTYFKSAAPTNYTKEQIIQAIKIKNKTGLKSHIYYYKKPNDKVTLDLIMNKVPKKSFLSKKVYDKIEAHIRLISREAEHENSKN